MDTTHNWQIQVNDHFRPSANLKHAVFDFDGTLSLVRGGWADIMVEQFLEHLPRHSSEEESAFRQFLFHEILALNGKPTVYQMQLLAELVVKRGGTPDTADNYNTDFQRRLRHKITERLSLIREQKAQRDQFLIHEARAMLTQMQAHGVTLHLLSGTAHPDLLIESAALGIADFFGPRIYGPKDLQPGFTKRAVFERIFNEYSLTPEQLICFGDGAVEIMDTRRLGGLAVAVASDENANGSGRLDEHKQKHLLTAGAQVVIPDYRHTEQLMALLMHGKKD